MNTPTRYRRARGLGIAELLVALAISASLLVAVAVAVDASFKAYRVNEEQASLSQNTRLVMNRIMCAIRRSETHEPDDDTLAQQFASGLVVTDTGIRVWDAGGTQTTYRYDAANKRVVIRDADGVDHVLLEGVDSFTIKMEPARSEEHIRINGTFDLLLRATVQLSARNTETAMLNTAGPAHSPPLTLVGSAAPRKNCW